MRSPVTALLAIAGTTSGLIALWAVTSRWDAIRFGHPSYLVFYALAMGLGLLAVFVARRGVRRRLLAVVGSIGLLVVALAGWWLRPFPADDVALEILGREGVVVDQSATSIVLEPDGEDPTSGLIFQPGARVDARAYLNILAPIAEAGHRVVIVKQPLGIAFLATGFAPDWIASNPALTWAAGGHSLGGVVASGAQDAESMLLWASYPMSDITAREGQAVVSVYGTADAIALPERIEASRSDLPESSTLVPVDGAIHSFFGDYGLQPGDGTPTVSRQAAQDEIVDASLGLLDPLAP